MNRKRRSLGLRGAETSIELSDVGASYGSKINPPQVNCQKLPPGLERRPIIAEHWFGVRFRSFGEVAEAVVADVARLAIARHLDSAAGLSGEEAVRSLAEADAIRRRLGWTWSQILGADANGAAA